VTYSWNFGGATGSATEGPGPITVNFTNITTGGYVAIEVAATDTFQRHDQPFARGASFTTNATVFVARILADTNRDGSISDADEDGKNAALTKERGALIPPGQLLGSNNHPNILNGLAPLQLICGPTLEPGDKLVLTKLDDPDKNLQIVDASSAGLLEFKDGKQEFTRETLANNPLNLLMGSACARNSNTNRFSLKLAFVRGGQTLVSDELKVGIAPIILPWECAPKEDIYTAKSIKDANGNDLFTVLTNCTAERWTQDMVKFGKVQCRSNQTTDVFLELNHTNRGNIASVVSNQVHIAGVTLDYGGNGGNIMATPPYTGAPMGSILIGDKAHANQNQVIQFWNDQGVQPVVSTVPTAWLSVGHIDEVVMFVSPDAVLVPDPQMAADALHDEIVKKKSRNERCGKEMWFGDIDINKVKSVETVVIADGTDGLPKKTVLTADMDAEPGPMTVEDAVFQTGDILRVDNEVLEVTGVGTGNQITVERGIGGTAVTTHSTNSVVYAYSTDLIDSLSLARTPYAGSAGQVQERLQAVRAALPTAFRQIPVPVLFGPILDYTPPRANLGWLAFSANMVNSVPEAVCNAGTVYYSQPGSDIFADLFDVGVRAFCPGISTILPVDVWKDYHCYHGEIHCGTAAKRQLDATVPWWTK
jgi:hypothetical protein